jgi:hypothetical protein
MRALGAEPAALPRLARRSDFVTLHVSDSDAPPRRCPSPA